MKIGTLVFTLVNFIIIGFSVATFAKIQIAVEESRQEIKEIKKEAIKGTLSQDDLNGFKQTGVPFANFRIVRELQEDLKME